MDVEPVKKDFPFFSKKNAQKCIYLDNAATTQKPEVVINAVADFYRFQNANPYRGIYPLAENATTLYEKARETVASFINAARAEEIVFTSGTTESINFVSSTWAETHIKKGDSIVITQVEHHANILPWQRLAEKTGAQLRFISFDTNNFDTNNFSLSIPENIIDETTKLVAVTHYSNVLGPVWQGGQLEALIKHAHSVGAKVLLDAAQSVPHGGVDVQTLNSDFLVFSGHKMGGPTGIGVLYIKKELHDVVSPYQVGGSMVHSVTFDDARWANAPQKFEAGTPPIAQAVGLAAAVNYIKKIDYKKIHAHERVLCNQLLDGLQKIPGVRILGNTELLRANGHLVSFVVDGIHAHDLAAFLGYKGIAVRAGHHCAQPLADMLGIDASLRVSFYLYNTEHDVTSLLSVLTQGIQELGSL